MLFARIICFIVKKTYNFLHISFFCNMVDPLKVELAFGRKFLNFRHDEEFASHSFDGSVWRLIIKEASWPLKLRLVMFEGTLLSEMTRHLKGNLFADKGFISGNLFKELYQRGLKLITGIRNNMKN